MYIVCPTCKAKYLVSDDILPSPLPQVRCCVCKNVWQLGKDDSADSQEDLAFLNIPLDASEPAPSYKPLVLGIFVLCILAGLWFGRFALTERFPFLEGAYKAFGITSVLAGQGLDFANIRHETVYDDDMEYLEIKGQVVNTTSRTLPLPKITANLFTKQGLKVGEKTISLPKDFIAEYESEPFKIMILAPSSTAEIIKIIFTE